MPQNQTIKDQADKGFKTVDLLNDRPKPGDGLLWANGLELIQVVGGAFTATRTAAGNYNAVRTATGAETHRFILSLNTLMRRMDVKGVKPTGFVISYNVGVANLTSTAFTAQTCTYADRVAAAAASYGGTITFDANHDTDAERISSTGANNPHLCEGTFATPEYINTDLRWMSVEFGFVMPNTSVLTIFGAGIRIEHDYL